MRAVRAGLSPQLKREHWGTGKRKVQELQKSKK